MSKTIKVTEEVHQQLKILGAQEGFATIDLTIKFLLENDRVI